MVRKIRSSWGRINQKNKRNRVNKLKIKNKRMIKKCKNINQKRINK